MDLLGVLILNLSAAVEILSSNGTGPPKLTLWRAFLISSRSITMDPITKSEFQDIVLHAAASGQLVPLRHSSTSLSLPQERTAKTILTPDMEESLPDFIQSGNFTAEVFDNKKFPHSRVVFVTSHDERFFVPASGVTKKIADSDQQMLQFYSGEHIGVHCCGENYADRSKRISKGELTFVRQLK